MEQLHDYVVVKYICISCAHWADACDARKPRVDTAQQVLLFKT